MACKCRSAAPNPGTRRSGMVGTAVAPGKGKHGRRARSGNRPRRHWRGDFLVQCEGQLQSDYAVRVALWEMGRMPTRDFAPKAATKSAAQIRRRTTYAAQAYREYQVLGSRQ